jgi:hypothetical protein
MEGFGFTYKCQCALLMGGSKFEDLLVGTRGKIPAPAPGTQFSSVLGCSPREVVERYFPNMPKKFLRRRGGDPCPAC